MERILVIGCCGAGKSTFAKKLQKALGHKLIHLDKLYWKAGWKRTPQEEWKEIVENVIGKDKWIMDGNYDSTLDLRLERADTVIFLDFPKFRCLWNSLLRIIRGRIFNKTRDCIAEGCKEKFTYEYFKWVWNYNKKVRPEYLEKMQALSSSRSIIHIKNYKQADNFLNRINLYEEMRYR